jgi:hypothetical protein
MKKIINFYKPLEVNKGKNIYEKKERKRYRKGSKKHKLITSE